MYKRDNSPWKVQVNNTKDNISVKYITTDRGLNCFML